MKTLFSILLICWVTHWVQAQSQFKQGEILVQFEQGVKAQQFTQNYTAQYQGAIKLDIKKEISEKLNIYLLGLQGETADEVTVLENLQNLPAIKNAQLNYPVQFRDSIPNDPLYDTQWNMDIIQAPQVWEVSTGGYSALGDEIVVAILDKGFDINHEDLKDALWQNPGEIPNDGVDNDGNGLVDDVNGWNFKTNSPNHPIEKHGTSVAGIVGASGNNGKGLAGINWNVKLMVFTVVYPDEIASAYEYVRQQRALYNASEGKMGAFVVATNASLGLDRIFCDQSPVWGAMYDPLGAVGVLNVAATSNQDWNVDELGDMPTTCPSDYLISVTNTDIEDKKVSNAAWGPEHIDLGAPGKPTTTTSIFSEYRDNFSGTSSASPHVAGLIGLLYSMPCEDLAEMALAEPAQTALLMRQAILEGVDPLPSLDEKTATGGRLNAFNSMEYLHGYCIAQSEEREANTFVKTYLNEQDFVRIYPNPAVDVLNIDYSTVDFTDLEINIFNTLGQLIYQNTIQSAPFIPQTFEVNNLWNWTVGTYFIVIRLEGEVITSKFIKER